MGIAHRLAGGGYDGAVVPEVTVTVGDGGSDPRKTLAPPPCTRCEEGARAGAPQDPVDTESASAAPPQAPADADRQAAADGTGGADGQAEQAGIDATSGPDDIDTTAAADAPAPTRLPDGALAALARGHLASARQALGPRLGADADARSQLTLAGQSISLAQLFTPAEADAALAPDLDRPVHAPGLSWDQATGRCAAWYTASCATFDTGAGPVPPTGHSAGPWDALFYRLTASLLQGQRRGRPVAGQRVRAHPGRRPGDRRRAALDPVGPRPYTGADRRA